MRSAIMMGIAAFLVVLGGAGGIAWYAKASGTKSAIEAAIAAVNAKEKRISYDSIETSGFPTHLHVTITRPRFTGRLDTLLKELNTATAPATASGTASRAQPFEDLPEWNEDSLLDGYLVLTVNALSDHFSVQSFGKWESKSTISARSFESRHEQNGNFYCSLALKRPSMFSDMWSFQTFERDPEQMLADFRLFDCAVPPVNSYTGQELISSSGPMRFYITSNSAPPLYHLRIYLNAADMQVTPKGDEFINTYTQAISPNQYHLPRRLSIYGKQKLDMDFAYNGPSSFEPNVLPNLEVNLNKLEITNDSYSTRMNFYLNNSTGPNNRVAQMSMRAESQFTPVYDQLIDDMLRTIISEVYTNPELRTPEMQQPINTYNQEQMYAILKPAVPVFSSFKKTVQSVDMHFQGPPDMTSGELTISDLEFSAEPYGIRAVGTGKSEPQKAPTGQLNVVCSNCLTLVDDAVNYLARLNITLQYFLPPEQLITVTPELGTAVKTFLVELAGPDKVNLTYDFVADDKGVIGINGKPLNIITSKYYQYIAPALKQQERTRR